MIPSVIRSFLLGVCALLIFLSCHRSPDLEELHQRAIRHSNVHLTGRVWITDMEHPDVTKFWSRVEVYYLKGSYKIVSDNSQGVHLVLLTIGKRTYRYYYRPQDPSPDASSFDAQSMGYTGSIDLWDIEMFAFGPSFRFDQEIRQKAISVSPPQSYGFPDPSHTNLSWFEVPLSVDYPGYGIAEIFYRSFRLGIRSDGLIQAASLVDQDSSRHDLGILYAQTETIEFGTVRLADLRLPAEAAKADWTGEDGSGVPPPPELISDK